MNDSSQIQQTVALDSVAQTSLRTPECSFFFFKELNCNLQCSNKLLQSFEQEACSTLSVGNVKTSAIKVTKKHYRSFFYCSQMAKCINHLTGTQDLLQAKKNLTFPLYFKEGSKLMNSSGDNKNATALIRWQETPTRKP